MTEGGKRSFLDSIPGWSGYRDRERRRESDRLLRERLARDYGEIADRLGRLASRMANDRKLGAIRHVDGPHSRLNHFIDRLKTATYGYAGLFSDRPVDEKALDQIAAFDASLGDGLEELDTAATALERADPDDTTFRERSEELTSLIETLLDRLDRRAELIESGEAQPDVEISALLGTSAQPGFTPTAYQLHDGDAVTYRNVNYTVVGRITIETPAGSWRDFQLQGGDGRSWLHVPGSAGGQFLWYRRVEPQGYGGERELIVDGTRYELTGSVEGTAEVIGSGGASGMRDMTAHSYRQVSGEGLLSVYHWRADDIALAGEPIDATELELWSREGGQAI
jgi:hypothetical protein